MWCRLTRQPAESWFLLSRAERKAMADLAVEVAEAERDQVKKARANAARSTRAKGSRHAR